MEDRAGTDLARVQATLEGDSAAFGELVTRYQRLVGSVAWRYGVQQEQIEDIVSEVFIKAFQNLHQFRPEHPFATWLYRLAANHVIDHKRRNRKERLRSEMPEQMADPSDGADRGVELDERARLMRDVMEELPTHYREVLFLVYVEEMKIGEISRMLGLPSGTIKTRLMRGRQAMRKLLVRRHPEHFGGDHAMS